MNFDDKLNKVVNDEINIPESILKKKDIAFEEIRKSKKKKRRFNNGFIAAAVLLILVTGIFSIKGENVLATIKEYLNTIKVLKKLLKMDITNSYKIIQFLVMVLKLK